MPREDAKISMISAVRDTPETAAETCVVGEGITVVVVRFIVVVVVSAGKRVCHGRTSASKV